MVKKDLDLLTLHYLPNVQQLVAAIYKIALSTFNQIDYILVSRDEKLILSVKQLGFKKLVTNQLLIV